MQSVPHVICVAQPTKNSLQNRPNGSNDFIHNSTLGSSLWQKEPKYLFSDKKLTKELFVRIHIGILIRIGEPNRKKTTPPSASYSVTLKPISANEEIAQRQLNAKQRKGIPQKKTTLQEPHFPGIKALSFYCSLLISFAYPRGSEKTASFAGLLTYPIRLRPFPHG